jgi:hypothetical protein
MVSLFSIEIESKAAAAMPGIRSISPTWWYGKFVRSKPATTIGKNRQFSSPKDDFPRQKIRMTARKHENSVSELQGIEDQSRSRLDGGALRVPDSLYVREDLHK